jgi:hypothetical protein
MEKRNPKEIKTHEAFTSLFPIREELLKKIEEDMEERDYDYSQPVILATWEGQDEPVCIDGHTRLQAAMNAGIEEVPVFIREEFDTEQEAVEHAIHLQCHRRNLTDAELMKYMKVLDKRGEVGRDSDTGQFTVASNGAQGKTSKATADLLNTSARKVEKMRTIQDHGDADTIEAVMQGEMSLNQGYNETQKKRKQDDVTDQEENGAGNGTTESQIEETPELVPDLDTGTAAERTEIRDSEPIVSSHEEDCENEGTEKREAISILLGYWDSLNSIDDLSVVEHLQRAIYFYLCSDEEQVIEVLRLEGYDENQFPFDDDEDDDEFDDPSIDQKTD